MAHKKGGGTAKTNRDSVSKRLGIKKYGGEVVTPGNIIVRQKGSKFHKGAGVAMGNDFTIYAVSTGKVQFAKKLGKTLVNVING